MATFDRGVEQTQTLIAETLASAGFEREAAAKRVARDLSADSDRDVLTQAVRAVLEPALGGPCGPLASLAAMLIDLAFDLVTRELADSRLPLLVLEDLFDARVTSECEGLFALLEERRAAIQSLVCSSANAKLVLLRACNDLLRRLSKSKNTNFCGRILMLLAYTLPLSERSGVNVRGVHNVNPLELGGGDGEGAPGDDAPHAVALSAPIDGEFYSTFWGLQAAFQQPHLALADEASWAATVAHVTKVLAVFAASPTRDSVRDGSAAERVLSAGGDERPPAPLRSDELLAQIQRCEAQLGGGPQGQHPARGQGLAESKLATDARAGEAYFSKFLTSPQLIALQMRDSYFRRHVLTQVACFCQTVCVQAGKGGPLASAAQRETARRLAEAVSKLLATTGPCASQFGRTVASLLRSELGWLVWKREGCPVFERDPLPAQPEADSAVAGAPALRKRPTADEEGRLGGGGERRRRIQLGSSELTRLWNQGGETLEELARLSERNSVPTLEAYLAPVIRELDPSLGIEDAYKAKSDKAYCWKALRLMHKTDLCLDEKFLRGGLDAVAAAITQTDKQPEQHAGASASAELEDEQQAADAPEAADEAEMAEGRADDDEAGAQAGQADADAEGEDEAEQPREERDGELEQEPMDEDEGKMLD